MSLAQLFSLEGNVAIVSGGTGVLARGLAGPARAWASWGAHPGSRTARRGDRGG
jgi:hypothetical protein